MSIHQDLKDTMDVEHRFVMKINREVAMTLLQMPLKSLSAMLMIGRARKPELLIMVSLGAGSQEKCVHTTRI